MATDNALCVTRGALAYARAARAQSTEQERTQAVPLSDAGAAFKARRGGAFSKIEGSTFTCARAPRLLEHTRQRRRPAGWRPVAAGLTVYDTVARATHAL
jgi:hypothetical protein